MLPLPGTVPYRARNQGRVPYDAAAGDHCTDQPDRFEAARGTADIKWRTDDLMDMPREEF